MLAERRSKTLLSKTPEVGTTICKTLLESDKELKPVAVISAAATEAGGGELGSGEYQEADFFRCTNIHQALFVGENEVLKKQFKGGKYLIPAGGGIYVPNVTVLREPQEKNYALCEPWHLSAYACATPKKGEPALWQHEMKTVIHNALCAAAEKGHNCIVFPVLGAGSAGGTATEFGECLGEVLKDEQFAGVFKNIIVAVKGRTPEQAKMNQEHVMSALKPEPVEKQPEGGKPLAVQGPGVSPLKPMAPVSGQPSTKSQPSHGTEITAQPVSPGAVTEKTKPQVASTKQQTAPTKETKAKPGAQPGPGEIPKGAVAYSEQAAKWAYIAQQIKKNKQGLELVADTNNLRKDVFATTQGAMKKGYVVEKKFSSREEAAKEGYLVEDGVQPDTLGTIVGKKYCMVDKDQVKEMQTHTVVIKDPTMLDNSYRNRYPEQKPTVKLGDTRAVCKELMIDDKELNPVAIISADANTAGGGALATGDDYQEAAFFRGTNIHQALFVGIPGNENTRLRENFKQLEQLENPKKTPPGKYHIPQGGGIYVPNVTVVREPEKEGYAFCEPWHLSAYACVAPREMMSDNVTACSTWPTEMQTLIRNTLRSMAEKGHNCIVFSALGTGTLQGGPEKFGAQLKIVLEEGEFKGVFKEIIVAARDQSMYKTLKNKLFDTTIGKNPITKS